MIIPLSQIFLNIRGKSAIVTIRDEEIKIYFFWRNDN